MRKLISWLALWAAFAGCSLPPARDTGAAALRRTSIREGLLVATLFEPERRGHQPGLVVLGGSEGGIEGAERLAEDLAAEGYVTLAVAYFGMEGVPATLQDVPLEIFDQAIGRIRRSARVDPRRIGLIGGSKGAEAVLLVASRRHDLGAVVAVVPSDVVWQGINRASREPRSSWTASGAPVPYVPFDRSQPFTTVFDLYERSRRAYSGTEADIPVEKIEAPLLLLAGEQDRLWPSADMTRRMARRLADHSFPRRFEHVEYADAGHAILGKPMTRERAATLTDDGGTAEGNFQARRAAWETIIKFLRETLDR